MRYRPRLSSGRLSEYVPIYTVYAARRAGGPEFYYLWFTNQRTMKKPLLFAVLCAAFVCGGCAGEDSRSVPEGLRTEHLENPVGTDAAEPRFTWRIATDREDFRQENYCVEVASSEELLTGGHADVWSSGTVRSSAMRAVYGGEPLRPRTKYYWRVTVWGNSGRCRVSPAASFETGKGGEAWTAQWITDRHDKEFEPAPMFRREFSLGGEVAKASLYIAAAGYYECFINGRRVGENLLDPGYTHFDKRVLYVTHDVTPLVREGANALAAVLGNGWYNEQSVAVWNFHEARWRDRPRMLCELHVTYADGSQQVVASDTTWRTATGPYTYNNLYSGDMYDARLEEPGWAEPGFDDRGWAPVVTTAAPAPIVAAQQMPAIRVTEQIAPDSVRAFGNRIYVYSFPKNMAGFCRLKVRGEAGTRIALRYGELLRADGRLEQGNIDVYYRPQKPYETFQQDLFTLRGTGEEEEFTPSFSYHGFQHVEVEASRPVTLTGESLTALFVHTDVEPVGSFACSSPLLNKVWDATMQAYRSNLHSIPTDCPQREKNGWTADAHVAVDLGLLGFDGITFYEKWMNDFIDNQRDGGDISGIIPSAGWGYGEWPGPVWDAAMFLIPDALYNYYGDVRCIETLYPAMERYLAYLGTKKRDGLIPFGIGDWVYWRTTTDTEFTSTAYYYYDNVLMARFARLTGREAKPYSDKAEELRERINARFFDPATGNYAGGTQAAQAVALWLGLVPDGQQALVARRLHELVAANDYFLDFGLLGSKTVPAMLTRYGYIEDAMRMVLKTDAPSWGYWVETMGYSTLPETWTLSEEFHDASLNHVFMGDVAAWCMNSLAGINYDPAAPGFDNILITPHFVPELDWAEGEYRSVRGLVASRWRREGGRVVLTVTVPAGSTAEVRVDGSSERLGSGTHTLEF